MAAWRNHRRTLKGPKAVHDAGSASTTGFFTTALRPKPPAQTLEPAEDPELASNIHSFAPTRVAHGEHCRRRPPEARHDRTTTLSSSGGQRGVLAPPLFARASHKKWAKAAEFTGRFRLGISYPALPPSACTTEGSSNDDFFLRSGASDGPAPA